MYKKYGKVMTVIGYTKEPNKVVSRIILKSKIKFYVAMGEKLGALDGVGVKRVPYAILMSRDGVVRWQGSSVTEEDGLTEDLIEEVVFADKVHFGGTKSVSV